MTGNKFDDDRLFTGVNSIKGVPWQNSASASLDEPAFVIPSGLMFGGDQLAGSQSSFQIWSDSENYERSSLERIEPADDQDPTNLAWVHLATPACKSELVVQKRFRTIGNSFINLASGNQEGLSDEDVFEDLIGEEFRRHTFGTFGMKERNSSRNSSFQNHNEVVNEESSGLERRSLERRSFSGHVDDTDQLRLPVRCVEEETAAGDPDPSDCMNPTRLSLSLTECRPRRSWPSEERVSEASRENWPHAGPGSFHSEHDPLVEHEPDTFYCNTFSPWGSRNVSFGMESKIERQSVFDDMSPMQPTQPRKPQLLKLRRFANKSCYSDNVNPQVADELLRDITDIAQDHPTSDLYLPDPEVHMANDVRAPSDAHSLVEEETNCLDADAREVNVAKAAVAAAAAKIRPTGSRNASGGSRCSQVCPEEVPIPHSLTGSRASSHSEVCDPVSPQGDAAYRTGTYSSFGEFYDGTRMSFNSHGPVEQQDDEEWSEYDSRCLAGEELSMKHVGTFDDFESESQPALVVDSAPTRSLEQTEAGGSFASSFVTNAVAMCSPAGPGGPSHPLMELERVASAVRERDGLDLLVERDPGDDTRRTNSMISGVAPEQMDRQKDKPLMRRLPVPWQAVARAPNMLDIMKRDLGPQMESPVQIPQLCNYQRRAEQQLPRPSDSGAAGFPPQQMYKPPAAANRLPAPSDTGAARWSSPQLCQVNKPPTAFSTAGQAVPPAASPAPPVFAAVRAPGFDAVQFDTGPMVASPTPLSGATARSRLATRNSTPAMSMSAIPGAPPGVWQQGGSEKKKNPGKWASAPAATSVEDEAALVVPLSDLVASAATAKKVKAPGAVHGAPPGVWPAADLGRTSPAQAPRRPANAQPPAVAFVGIDDKKDPVFDPNHKLWARQLHEVRPQGVVLGELLTEAEEQLQEDVPYDCLATFLDPGTKKACTLHPTVPFSPSFLAAAAAAATQVLTHIETEQPGLDQLATERLASEASLRAAMALSAKVAEHQPELLKLAVAGLTVPEAADRSTPGAPPPGVWQPSNHPSPAAAMPVESQCSPALDVEASAVGCKGIISAECGGGDWGGEARCQPVGDLSNGEAKTFMVRNIPIRYTQDMLLKEWPNNGEYDFLYLPICIGRKGNASFAFINFVTEEAASEFHARWHKQRLQHYSARKPLDISPAHVQGRDDNLLQIVRNKTFRIKNAHFQPAIFHGTERINMEDFLDRLDARCKVSGISQKC